jgi:hypothetical protein
MKMRGVVSSPGPLGFPGHPQQCLDTPPGCLRQAPTYVCQVHVLSPWQRRRIGPRQHRIPRIKLPDPSQRRVVGLRSDGAERVDEFLDQPAVLFLPFDRLRPRCANRIEPPQSLQNRAGSACQRATRSQGLGGIFLRFRDGLRPSVQANVLLCVGQIG